MATSTETRINDIVAQVEHNNMPVRDGIKTAIDLGYCAIGTAVHVPTREPRVLITCHRFTNGSRRWGLFTPGRDGSAAPAVLASRVVETALWGTLGDPNHPLQRQALGLPLDAQTTTPDSGFGTHGWGYDRSSGLYVLTAEEPVLNAASDVPDEAQIGNVDFVPNNWFTELSTEPGHVVSANTQTTVATMPVRMGDLRPLIEDASIY